ncbi:protein VARIATION IN COMPOUND TRIGGERED ROOT growth response-like [Ziziphus jujuba]|uniref:Protein VARIATION IN COMPOUND TRIGGERED ROOT growth response-like n=1 Tax=Ziziphus jujuba TaxID=326968 RepID=A0ABM4AB66_ZIZJJ|nr:protein VARIATION IN COMPOUND TRIGGERED ROOT growth response-like [Ziziphus jujuba]
MASCSLSSAICPREKHDFQEKYDVFLSFRGKDTGNTFARYLYGALCAKQTSTFMDDHGIERGDEISPTFSEAIEESKISVIIFSENYAFSTWCLDELLQILECKKNNGQIVMPDFYGIDPSVIRKQNGSYGVAFAELEQRFKDRMEKVQQWRDALAEASNLCGFDSKAFRPEAKLVQKIVEDISLKLPDYPPSNEHYKGCLMGIEKHIKEIKSLLCIGSIDVRIIGIWGMGGIGKTTLASVVYQELSYSQFEGCSFLPNIREEYARCRPNHLRKKLLSELLNDVAISKMDTPFVASPYITDKLHHKKVLIVLDDVDDLIRLDSLVEGYDQHAPGSRIIVTNRNVQMGQKIVCDGHTEPGDRSRLWDVKDVCHLLERDTGTVAVEVISFNMFKMTRDVKMCRAALSKTTPIETLHLSIMSLSGLVELDLCNCKQLKTLPTSIWKVKSLQSFYLTGCVKLGKFPEISEPMEHLTSLWLHETGIKELLKFIDNLIPLESVDLRRCKEIEFLLDKLSDLRKLKYLLLKHCSKLQELPPLAPALSSLSVEECESLKSIPDLPLFCTLLEGKYCLAS